MNAIEYVITSCGEGLTLTVITPVFSVTWWYYYADVIIKREKLKVFIWNICNTLKYNVFTLTLDQYNVSLLN